jgi:tetratricopeptide (TPR) repeat protein
VAATALDSPRQIVVLLTAYAAAGTFLGHPAAAEATEALRLAEEIGDRRLLGRSRLALAQVLSRKEHEFGAALELVEAVLADDPTHWFAPALHGLLLAETGRLDDAKADLDRAGKLLPRSSSVARWLVLEYFYMILDTHRGAFEVANRRAVRFLEQSERHKNRFAVGQALLVLGECSLVAGRYHEAIDHLERTLEQGHSTLFPRAQAPLIFAFTRVGDRDRARELLEVWRAHGSPPFDSRTHIARAMIELSDPEEFSDAEAYLDEIERLAIESGTLYFRAPHRECRAALAARRDDDEGRLHHLREAQLLYAEMGATGHAERLARELGE